jgi:hypothetical protein
MKIYKAKISNKRKEWSELKNELFESNEKRLKNNRINEPYSSPCMMDEFSFNQDTEENT